MFKNDDIGQGNNQLTKAMLNLTECVIANKIKLNYEQ